MKYAADLYAKAFLETKADPKRLLAVVKKNGDLLGLHKIVAAIETLLVKKAGGHIVHLEFARTNELADKFVFSPKDRVSISINPALIAGVRITIDGEKEFDNSFQRKVNQLFL